MFGIQRQRCVNRGPRRRVIVIIRVNDREVNVSTRLVRIQQQKLFESKFGVDHIACRHYCDRPLE